MAFEGGAQIAVVRRGGGGMCPHHHIETAKFFLCLSKRFPYLTAHAIAFSGETKRVASHHETEARVVPVIHEREHGEVGVAHPRSSFHDLGVPRRTRKPLRARKTVTGACQFGRTNLTGQALAPFAAAATQDRAATFGFHARAETVRAAALAFAGLISAFHGAWSAGS